MLVERIDGSRNILGCDPPILSIVGEATPNERNLQRAMSILFDPNARQDFRVLKKARKSKNAAAAEHTRYSSSIPTLLKAFPYLCDRVALQRERLQRRGHHFGSRIRDYNNQTLFGQQGPSHGGRHSLGKRETPLPPATPNPRLPTRGTPRCRPCSSPQRTPTPR